MSVFRKSSKYLSSRRQISIEKVTDNVLVLPGGSYRAILQLSSINFELKSEVEQDSILEIYQGFLNSLSHDVQYVVRIRELEADKYLHEIKTWIDQENDSIFKNQLTNYLEFLSELVQANTILTRNFYIVINYENSEGKDESIAAEQLALRCDIVSRGLGRLGIKARRLETFELLDLFYSFYNPNKSKIQPLSSQIIHTIYDTYIRKEVEDA